MVADLIKTLEEKRKELYKDFISQIISIPSSNRSADTHYEYVETGEVKRIREIIEKHPKPKELQEFENEYDKLAYEIIGFKRIISKEEFIKIIPDLNAEIVFYLLRRMSKQDEYNTKWNVEFNKKTEQLRASNGKTKKTNNKWSDWDKKIEGYLEEGIVEAIIIRLIGDAIEKSGEWNELSRQEKGKIVTRPDIGTIRNRIKKIKNELKNKG
ncbi:hypothetical protein IVG45_18910 [Methylomonas sp. LL1]|uniref:hypothetical protein n=1 Tax=Methylomonas sp. LL1 TaxID=2785785 RepID=UPI0018C35D1B|nr:hypothetical protein [Methylomonas sp. LL1]QPK62872.1 hypothetical protein IVG45_18910 [Methylomonas sp. LL1]